MMLLMIKLKKKTKKDQNKERKSKIFIEIEKALMHTRLTLFVFLNKSFIDSN